LAPSICGIADRLEVRIAHRPFLQISGVPRNRGYAVVRRDDRLGRQCGGHGDEQEPPE
jgi:hypothetical protein